MASWWRGYIARRARQLGLDPNAVLAVAAQEGLGGGIGDRGTSFGPFQLHVGGALPAGRGRGWAESPAGIDYALQRIAGVARGQHGAQAIQSIVSRFERPADPRSEIAGALRVYGSGAGSMGAAGPPAAGVSSAPASFSGDARQNLLASLITASQQSGHGRTPDYTPVFAALSQLRQGSSLDSSTGNTPPTGASGGPSQGGSSLSFLEPFAHKFNLQITSTTEGNHVPGSYHYQGRAVDYGGDPMRMAALQRYALAHPQEFVEVFYTGPGAAPYYVKNGKVLPIASLDRSVRDHHHNHVHLAR